MLQNFNIAYFFAEICHILIIFFFNLTPTFCRFSNNYTFMFLGDFLQYFLILGFLIIPA